MTSKRIKVSFQRREDSTSSYHCCVPQCTASATFNRFLSFHTFPKDKETQKRWIVNIQRDSFTVTSQTRVCSRHFQSADLIEPQTPAGRRRLKNGAVPVLFQWNNFTLPAPRTGVWERITRLNTDTLHTGDAPSMDAESYDHDYCSTAEPAALDLSLEHTEDLRVEITKLRKQIEEITLNSKFCLERFAASDDDIWFYTRFATHAHLMAFWRQIEPATGKIVRVTRAQTAAVSDEVPHTANATSLQPIDEFFLFMTYLSLGLMQKDLAHRFRIHQSTVSCIINTWANFLYGLRCQTPNSLLLQSEVFSTYKSHCTFKGLIGIAPHGALTFVSSLYEGAISDKEILKQSSIVSLLKPTMAIMVDKGFLVEDFIPCKIHIPTFLSKRAQLSRPELRKTQSIARLRVHVERLIRRVKEHKIFNTMIPLSLTGSINQLYTVACLLVNYQNGPLVKGWARDC
ncbi:uncharacterized protein LOC127508816 [Ctenopharyngodon idella]|uniref:uncharacterized protein LOC127508816 n=1 Tax=Ctenopharyngodon idella TaxID=7959 RepID=UPI00222F2C77|nr:uncharacterized protein LOC127508816 [Ctenopharyngodon idella]